MAGEAFTWGAGGSRLTPGQIAAQRQVAQAMMLRGNDYSPIKSGWQGAARVAEGLLGGLEAGRADRAETQNREEEAKLLTSLPTMLGGGVSAPAATAMPAAQPPGPMGQTSIPAGKDEFVSTIMPLAQSASAKTGIDPRVIVAQAALESGWGKSAPGNNLFGIKSHGQAGGNTLPTTEVIDGQPVRTSDSFRAYASPADAVAGYADFMIKNPRYASLRSAQGIDAQVDALGKSGYATDPAYGAKVGQIARSLPAPAAPDATAASAATPSAGVQAVAQAQMSRVNPQLLAASASPYVSEGTKHILGMVLQQQMKPQEFTYQTTPDGTILRMDPRGGAPVPVYNAATKPTFTKVGTDPATGQDVMGFVDANGRKVEEYKPASATPAQASTIPPVPAGVDPKVWRETFSKNAAAGATPGSFDDTSKMRHEFTQLPSYKNMAQAAPVYQSMHDAAGRDTKAADLNIVYGLGKIMDPGSVVREGELQLANNAQGLQERLNGIIAQINQRGALTPEGRQALMAEAHSRMISYKQQFDLDAGRYKGITERNRINTADVVPDFGTFEPWLAPKAAAPGAAPAAVVAPPAAAPANPVNAGKVRRYNPATGALE